MSAATSYGLDDASPSLRHYLRALWRRDFKLIACDKPAAEMRPFISEMGIHLPRQYNSHRGSLLRDLYRAAAAHAAAHDAYSTIQFERKKLKPVQLAIIALLEDARVEQLAITAMPGLRHLWLSFFDPRGRDSIAVEALLLRLAHVLLDPTREDDNPWVMKGKRLFYESQSEGSNALALREIGSQLGNDIGQMRAQFNAKSYLVEPVYRDDNLFLWDSDAAPEETREEDAGFNKHIDAAQSTPRHDDQASNEERFRPRAVATASDEDDSGSNNDYPTYPEWDERTGHFRPRWCRIIEQVPDIADATQLKQQLSKHASLSARLAQLLQARKMGIPQRQQRQSEGDEIELDALVRVQAAQRAGHTPDLNIFKRIRQQKPDLSVLLLLDLSVSTNAKLVNSSDKTSLLSFIREASVLLGEAIELSGDQLAIHGFRSNGRHEVNYLRFKEFGQSLDDAVLGRLSAVDGALSTRMGAAIRHASQLMRSSKSAQRLILVLTDGEPHDIDVFHPQVLMHDAAKAVTRSAAEGTPVFCVSVDKNADAYVSKIFGAHQYLVIDSVEQLPQRLPALYLRLTA